MRYLDPKADLTFKKIFGEHKDLLISLLNALLPLADDEQIESVEYLSPELVPETYVGKNSIVDVRCRDVKGRQFIVEMQMLWTEAFKQRVLFNASKAFVRQLDKKRKYELLQPVYSLNLVNETFMKDYPDEFIHNYSVVHEFHSDEIIEGLHFTFVELPKFQAHSLKEKKMAVLWLRFLTEIDEQTKQAPQELLDNPETRKALKAVEESAMTQNELLAYEDFWDKLGAERLLFVDSNRINREEGRAEGRAEGRTEGIIEGCAKVAKNLLNLGMALDEVAKVTGLDIETIEKMK
jgi:predicted transposase/invertase (TIGR01784 family)